MLLIEVNCPHCGAHGQKMMPPVGAIIIGPCPECQELVVVFCGHLLALNKEIMVKGSVETKREHLVAVLTEFIRGRVELMIPEGEDGSGNSQIDEIAASATRPPAEQTERHNTGKPISVDEVHDFHFIDLSALDDPSYFRENFGRPPTDKHP